MIRPVRFGRYRRADPGGGRVVRDAGFTLTELLVYMVILSAALAIALAAVLQMSQVLVQTTSAADASNGLWKATSILDRQVRNANAVNVPGPAGSTPAGSDPLTTTCDPSEACFVEMRTTKASTYSEVVCPGCADGTQVCTQWWTDPEQGTLSWRWWEDTASPTPSDPIVVVSNLVAGQSPAFRPGFSDVGVVSFPLQALTVDLSAQESDQTSRRQTTYTARNSEQFYQQQIEADWGLSACQSVDRTT